MLKIDLFKCLVPIHYKNKKGYLLNNKIYPVKTTKNLGIQILVENGFWCDVPPKLLENQILFEKVGKIVLNNFKELNDYIDKFIIDNKFKSKFEKDFYLVLNPLEIKKISLNCLNNLYLDFSDYISNYELTYHLKNENIVNLNNFIKKVKFGDLEKSLINYLLN